MAEKTIRNAKFEGTFKFRNGKTHFRAGAKVGGAAGWVVAAADNVDLITCPAGQTASKLVIPLDGLRVGMGIMSFNLVGQIESGGNAVTVDADLRVHTAAAADVTDASVASITQLSVTADTIMGEANTRKTLTTVREVALGETYYIVVTATTGAATDIALQGAVVETQEAMS